jgi:hypothetical protein
MTPKANDSAANDAKRMTAQPNDLFRPLVGISLTLYSVLPLQSI